MSREWKKYTNFKEIYFFQKIFKVKYTYEFIIQKSIFFKKIANYSFKIKDYYSALVFFSLALSNIKFLKYKDRSLYFSNRGQCWISLDVLVNSIIDCSFANKLAIYCQKSWYRKIFAYNRTKDCLGSFFCLIKISILVENRIKKIIFFQLEQYCNDITKEEKSLLKSSYWRKINKKKPAKKSKKIMFVRTFTFSFGFCIRFISNAKKNLNWNIYIASSFLFFKFLEIFSIPLLFFKKKYTIRFKNCEPQMYLNNVLLIKKYRKNTYYQYLKLNIKRTKSRNFI
nr:hypothetical protein 1634Bnrm1_p059 [Cryptomonas sp.]